MALSSVVSEIFHVVKYCVLKIPTTMGLSRTFSEIHGDFSRKSQKKFPTPLYFVPPLKGFPWELGTAAGGSKN